MLNAHILLERRGETILEGLIEFEDFGEPLNLYLDVLEEFETVKGHYDGLIGSFRRTLVAADKESLFNCIRTLRDIANHPSVISQSRLGSLVDDENLISYEKSLMYHLHKLRRETEGYIKEFGAKVPYSL
ncbi:hypothetical protein HYV89_00930 [Candidatus Woesearchaeota archaeon]|nr:hypothetical protein [Candidatus Woesearchaeota archaeon]